MVLAASACRQVNPNAPVPQKGAGVLVEVGHHSPLTPKELPTNDPVIAVGNMEGTLADLEKRLPAMQGAQRGAGLRTLATLLLGRGELLGRIADYERAVALAEEAVRIAPSDKYAWLARGAVRARFHRFAEALEDLASAQKAGATLGEVEGPRASVLQALGWIDEAEAIRVRMVAQHATLSTLGSLAGIYADEGRTQEAEKTFVEAQYHFADISPIPVAWLWLQQSMMWQREGSMGRARELLEAAHERLPQSVSVTGHLAAILALMGERSQAAALLQKVVATSDDPELKGQLAELMRQSGDVAHADRLRAGAARGYEALLAAHPEAFADHAARFYLLAPGDAGRALELARQNWGLRQTPESYDLVIEAALAAKAPTVACTIVSTGLAKYPRTPHTQALAWKAYTACGDRVGADRALHASGL